MRKTARNAVHVLNLLHRLLRIRPRFNGAYAFHDLADLCIEQSLRSKYSKTGSDDGNGAYIELKFFAESQVTRDTVETYVGR